MKKLLLVPVLLLGGWAFGQNLDTPALDAMFKRAEQHFIKGHKDSVLLVLDTLTIESKKSKNYSVYTTSLLAKANILEQLHFSAKSKQVATLLYEESIKFLNPDDPSFLTIYNDLAVLAHNSSVYDERDFYLQKARDWMQEFGSSDELLARYVKIILNMAVAANDDGDFYKSIDYSRQVLQMIPDSLKSSLYFIGQIRKSYEHTGTSYVGLKQYKKAIESFTQSHNVPGVEKLNDLSHINMLNRRMAFAYLQDGNPHKAISLCKDILAHQDYYQSVQQKEYDEAWIYHTLGQCYTAIADYDQAHTSLAKAIELRKSYYFKYQGFSKNNFVGATIFRLAELLKSEGKKEAALETMQEALIQYCISFDDSSPSSNPEVKDLKIAAFYLVEILKSKAELQYEIYTEKQDFDALKSSLNTYALLIDVIDRDRQRYKAERSKIFLIAEAKPSFEGAISVAWELYEKTSEEKFAEMAFQFAEKSKAVLLYAALKETEAQYSGLVPDSLVNKENQLQKKWDRVKERIYQANSATTLNDSLIHAYNKEAFELEFALDALNEKLKIEFPRYYELKNASGGIGIQEIQRLNKKANRQLVEFFVGDKQIFVFNLKPKEFSIHKLARTSDFEQTLSLILGDLHGLKKVNKAAFNTSAHALYKALFSQLKIEQGPQNLVIIPDGRLGYLPFEVLIPAEGSEDYLLADYSTSYAYSAKLLYRNPINKIRRENPQHAWKGYAPDYTGDEYLAFNRDEILGVKDYFLGTARLGSEALESAYLAEAENHAILHFAMHGYLNTKDPMYSYLAFSKDSTQDVDGKLYAYQIFNQKLNADLVVLSACNTGYGPLVKGEGIMSLARAFRYAGSASVLMNLWQNDGSVSSQLMNFFYAQLKEGLPKDEALRLAKVNYLAQATPNRRSPRNWANLVLIGENRPVRQGKPFIWIGGIIGILVVAIGFIFFMRKTHKSD